jgi:ubiquinone biosynthesis protein Coq4
MTQLKFLTLMLRLASDPERTDLVFRMSDLIRRRASPADRASYNAELMKDADYKALFESGRPELLATPYDIAALAAMPAATLGHAYGRQMQRLGLDPEFFEYIPADDPLSYLHVRMRKTHDIWHVVAGYDTSIPGEIGLQAFYFGQLRSPLPIAIMTSNFFHLLVTRDMRTADAVFTQMTSGYLRGKAARQLKGVIWEDLWEQDLAAVRQSLGVVV